MTWWEPRSSLLTSPDLSRPRPRYGKTATTRGPIAAREPATGSAPRSGQLWRPRYQGSSQLPQPGNGNRAFLLVAAKPAASLNRNGRFETPSSADLEFLVEEISPRPTGGGGYFEPHLSFSCDIF